MMNHKRGQNFMDPLAQSKITRLEGTVGTMVPPGLPKADSLPQYSQDKSLPYRRTYISCSLSGQEALDLPSAWSPSRTYVRNGESPSVHSAATEGSMTHQAFYRPDNVAFPVDRGSPASVEALTAKHKLAYYDRSKHSPSTAGVVSPVAFRKLPVGCTSLSPSSGESPVGLAVPKPVYGHSPCFTDLKRTVGQNYAVERGLQRVPPQMFEDDWAAHYGHWAYLHKMEQEALMQQRISLQFEHCGERVPLKDVTPQGYHGLSPSRSRRSAFAEPNNSGYIYSPAHTGVPASAEQCQHYQIRPQMHKDLASFYKPLTRMHYGPSPTQIYQDRPHISKYGEIPQNSLLYCPQNSTEQSIYRPENPHHIAEKPQQTSGQCSIPQSYYSDLSHPYTMVPTSHSAVRNLHPYPGFRMHLNTNQMNKFTERLCPPPVTHQVDRPLDFSIRRDQNTESHREPNGHFGISGTFHQAQASNCIGAQSGTLGASNQKPGGFPVGSSQNYTSSPQCTAAVSNKNPGLCISNTNSPANTVEIHKRHSEESDNGCESLIKVQKMDQHESDGSESPSSPPMPVINKVFSLAPYKAYLEVAGMFSPANDSSSSKLHSDSKPLKEEARTQRTNPKPSPCQDDLKLKEVKTSLASNLNSDSGLQMVKVKKEKLETDEAACKSEMKDRHSPASSQSFNNGIVKKEPADLEPADFKPANSEPADIKLAHLEPADLKPAADQKLAADLKPANLKLEADLKPANLKLEADLNPDDLKLVTDTEPADLKLVEDIKPAHINTAVCDTEHKIVVMKSDFEPESQPVTPEIPEPSVEWKSEAVAVDELKNVQTKNTKPCELPAIFPPKPPAPPQTPHILQPTFALSKIPPHCLKLSSYNIIMPEVLKSSLPSNPVLPLSPVETSPAKSSSSRQARHQFMELHQSLCTLISTCVSQTSHWELREWLSSLNLVSPPVKTQKVSCLLGSKAREVWLKGEGTVAALQKVLDQLEAYVVRRECPFLHVMRAGAVFIPMLVVKEVLFPQIQGTFIDQVLQEHRVELRPTTLSEERHLTQLHKRAFSSKLRRLLSLKHLPDIYPDVVNLLYYSKACSVLGVELKSNFKTEYVECSDEAESSVNELEVSCTSPTSQTPETETHLENIKESSRLKKHKIKGRVKSSCKRMFLEDNSSSSEDEADDLQTESWCFEGLVEGEMWDNDPVASNNEEQEEQDEGHVEVKIEVDTEQEVENSWARPLTSDDLSSGNSDVETEVASWSSHQSWSSSSFSKSRSGMILKLRKVYYASGRQGRVSRYQRVLDHSEVKDTGGRGKEGRKRRHKKREHRTSKHKKRPSFSSSLHRAKYCSYLSAQHTSKHRRRWVLRSAVQTGKKAGNNGYPDLVGKRIRHLYEENDKTEVWYRGVVLRVHEPHPDPLKTVFEVKYDSEPEWQYYLELLVDYKKGWLKIED